MTRWSYPLFQGFQEFFIRPAADAGFRIACNIRCIENPERGFQRPPTGEWLAVVLDIGMAAITPTVSRRAVAPNREKATPLIENRFCPIRNNIPKTC